MIGLNNEPEFSTTIYFPLRRTLVLQQVYSALMSSTCSIPIFSAVLLVTLGINLKSQI